MVNEGRIETTLSATGDMPPVEDNSPPVEMPLEPPSPPNVAEVHFSVDPDGFISGYSSSSTGENCVALEIDLSHPIFADDYRLWRIEDGSLIKHEERLEELLAEEASRPPSTEEQLKAENKALSDRMDFLESVLEEMIFSIYE